MGFVKEKAIKVRQQDRSVGTNHSLIMIPQYLVYECYLNVNSVLPRSLVRLNCSLSALSLSVDEIGNSTL